MLRRIIIGEIMKTTIVKIQRPLFTNEPVDMALIYDEPKKLSIQVPLDSKLSPFFEPFETKIYMSAEVHRKGNELSKIILLEKLPAQDW